MNETDATSIYYYLLDILHQHRIIWVIDQVNEALLLGKIATKKVRPFREQYTRIRKDEAIYSQPDMLRTFEYAVPTGPETDLTTTLSYTPQERLILLIDAIEQAVVESAAMQQNAIQTLEGMGVAQQIKGISFVSEQEDDQGHFISQQQNNSKTFSAKQLHQLLTQIRDQVHDNQ